MKLVNVYTFHNIRSIIVLTGIRSIIVLTGRNVNKNLKLIQVLKFYLRSVDTTIYFMCSICVLFTVFTLKIFVFYCS